MSAKQLSSEKRRSGALKSLVLAALRSMYSSPRTSRMMLRPISRLLIISLPLFADRNIENPRHTRAASKASKRKVAKRRTTRRRCQPTVVPGARCVDERLLLHWRIMWRALPMDLRAPVGLVKVARGHSYESAGVEKGMLDGDGPPPIEASATNFRRAAHAGAPTAGRSDRGASSPLGRARSVIVAEYVDVAAVDFCGQVTRLVRVAVSVAARATGGVARFELR